MNLTLHRDFRLDRVTDVILVHTNKHEEGLAEFSCHRIAKYYC